MIPTKRQQAARETRRKILETALALVREGGFEAVSVDAITRSAGVAKGTFYVHFPTKAHLVRELCREPFEALAREVLAARGGAAARLARLFRGHARLAEKAGIEIAREWFRIAVDPAAAAALGLDTHARDRGLVAAILRDAAAAGELHPGAASSSLAPALAAQLHGMAAAWCMTGEARALSAATEAFLRDQLPALLAPLRPSGRATKPSASDSPSTKPRTRTSKP